MIAVAVRTCLEKRHSMLRRSFDAWRKLPLVSYLQLSEREVEDVEVDLRSTLPRDPGAYVEVRRCDCGAQLGVVFHPDLEGLGVLRRIGFTLLQLADLVGRGSREAGIVLQERQMAVRS